MERSILPATWQIPVIFRKRLGNTVGRQRVMLHDGHLLLVLHRPPLPNETTRDGRFFWREPDGTWHSSDHGAGPQSLSRFLDEYGALVGAYDQSEEQASSAPQYFSIISGLSPLLRAARHVHQTLEEARKLVPDDRDLLDARDRSYEIERTAELLFNDAKNSLDFLVAQRAEQHAESSRRMEVSAHRLNLLAAFFLPIATISGVLEVDAQQAWLHVQRPWTAISIVVVGVAAGFFLTLLVAGGRPTKPSDGVKPVIPPPRKD